MNKSIKKLIGLVAVTSVTLSLFGCGNASKKEGQAKKTDFPKKQIEITVPFSAGGGTDSVARALADSAKDSFSKPVVVVNKTGGGGAVGMSAGANAKPDGHSVTMITVELATLPHLGLAPFDYTKFKPILQVNEDPTALTVRADAPWKTVQEFVEYAKKNPNKVKIGNSGVGAIWHLAAAALEDKTGAKFNNIPYEGAAPAVAGLLGGHIDAVTVSPAEVVSQVKAGKLKMLAVGAKERLKESPDVPTYKESGIDLEIGTWRGFGVPKDTPDDVVKILQDGFTKAANDKKFKDFMDKANLGVKVLDSNQFEEKIKNDNELFKKLIDKLGLKK